MEVDDLFTQEIDETKSTIIMLKKIILVFLK